MTIINPENILIPSEYFITLSRFILDANNAIKNRATENPAANSIIFTALKIQLPVDAL